jgi:hypothetical protein
MRKALHSGERSQRGKVTGCEFKSHRPLFARLVVSQFTFSEGKRDVDQCGVHGG